jgi:putative aldouronate transport system substrate-binding protein
MKKMKKAAALSLAASLCASIPAVSPVLADESDPFQFDSVADVTFPLAETLTLDVFVYASNTGGGTMQDNYVTDWIEEQTNIHLNFVYDVDGDEAKTKLNLLMTDPDNLPDFFLTTCWTKAELSLYAEQGLVIPLDDYLVDAENWNASCEVSPSRKADLTMNDGHIYSYGTGKESFHNVYQNRMWIYMPWVEQLNDGHIPETTEELYEYLVKVKTQDPNGNGIADEIPMTGYLGGWSTDPTVWLINSFVQCNNPLSNTNPTVGAGFNISEDGQVEFAPIKDEYQDALAYISKLYQEGLLDQQTFTQDSTQFAATLNNEENLVALHAAGRNQADKATFNAGLDGSWSDWVCIVPVEGPDGVRLAARSNISYFASCSGVISKNCEYPEIVVALFDWLASKEGSLTQEYGPEGVTWDFVDEGISVSGDTAQYKTMALPDDFDWIGNGFTKSYDNVSWPSDVCINSLDTAFKSSILVEDPAKNLEYILYHAAKEYEEYAPSLESILPDLTMETADAKAVSEYTTTIGGYVNQATVQFITGDLDVEKDWDTYISRLKSMGVDDYIQIYQKYYDIYEANQE